MRNFQITASNNHCNIVSLNSFASPCPPRSLARNSHAVGRASLSVGTIRLRAVPGSALFPSAPGGGSLFPLPSLAARSLGRGRRSARHSPRGFAMRLGTPRASAPSVARSPPPSAPSGGSPRAGRTLTVDEQRGRTANK